MKLSIKNTLAAAAAAIGLGGTAAAAQSAESTLQTHHATPTDTNSQCEYTIAMRNGQPVVDFTITDAKGNPRRITDEQGIATIQADGAPLMHVFSEMFTQMRDLESQTGLSMSVNSHGLMAEVPGRWFNPQALATYHAVAAGVAVTQDNGSNDLNRFRTEAGIAESIIRIGETLAGVNAFIADSRITTTLPTVQYVGDCRPAMQLR